MVLDITSQLMREGQCRNFYSLINGDDNPLGLGGLYVQEYGPINLARFARSRGLQAPPLTAVKQVSLQYSHEISSSTEIQEGVLEVEGLAAIVLHLIGVQGPDKLFGFTRIYRPEMDFKGFLVDIHRGYLETPMYVLEDAVYSTRRGSSPPGSENLGGPHDPTQFYQWLNITQEVLGLGDNGA